MPTYGDRKVGVLTSKHLQNLSRLGLLPGRQEVPRQCQRLLALVLIRRREAPEQHSQAAVQSVQLQTNAALASVSDNRQLAEVYTKALGGLDALADTAEVMQISAIYLRVLVYPQSRAKGARSRAV